MRHHDIIGSHVVCEKEIAIHYRTEPIQGKYRRFHKTLKYSMFYFSSFFFKIYLCLFVCCFVCELFVFVYLFFRRGVYIYYYHDEKHIVWPILFSVPYVYQLLGIIPSIHFQDDLELKWFRGLVQHNNSSINSRVYIFKWSCRWPGRISLVFFTETLPYVCKCFLYMICIVNCKL